jgi:hypothetical protein
MFSVKSVLEGWGNLGLTHFTVGTRGIANCLLNVAGLLFWCNLTL